ncbi:alpha-L-fucosidase [Sphingobacterium multivorum]|uniref:alpha-L-fucosidase n=1 Tax=Sphingobacterium multivorum TaxID=28454 RepID=UPI003DA64E15
MAEEEGKVIQWPGGADEATDFDFLMVGKNNKPIMKIPKEKLNEVIVINGEGVKAVAGGASSSTPTILRPGPAGQNRKMEDVQGWFVNGTADNPPVAVGEPWEAPAGKKNTNWWDGDTWSLGSSVPLPKGKDGVNGADGVDGKDGQGLLPLWDSSKVGGYMKDAQVRDANGVTYVSLKDGNTSALSVEADWKYIGVSVKSETGDSETAAASQKLASEIKESIDSKLEIITDNEFAIAIVDSEGDILWGKRVDGTTYDCDDTQSRLNAIFSKWVEDNLQKIETLNSKSDVLDTSIKSISDSPAQKNISITSNSEFIYAIVDSNNNVIWGKRYDGTTFDIDVTNTSSIGDLILAISTLNNKVDLQAIDIDSLDEKTDQTNGTSLTNADKISNSILYTKKVLLQEWEDMRSGLFVHWGVYSVLGGKYNGVDYKGDPVEFNYSGPVPEWILNQIPMDKTIYKSFQSQFNSSKFDPDEYCRLAKRCGLKYVVMSIRHHDGFSLVPSDLMPWDIRTSNADNDVIFKFRDACIKHGLKFGIYYSYFVNWTATGGYDQKKWNNGIDPYSESQHRSYVENEIKYINYLISSLQPHIIFYDNGPSTSSADIRQLFDENQKRNYPLVIVNDRAPITFDYTSGESSGGWKDIFDNTRSEFCFNIGGWGYSEAIETANSYPTLGVVLYNQLEALARGQNWLINVSPKGDGSIPVNQASWFNIYGKWVQKYVGDFSGFKKVNTFTGQNNGRVVRRGNSIYYFTFGADTTIYLDGVETDNLKSVYVFDIANPESQDNFTVISNDRLEIRNIPYNLNYQNPRVVKIDYNGGPVYDDYINVSVDSPIRPSSYMRTYRPIGRTDRLVNNFRAQLMYTFDAGGSQVTNRFKFNSSTGVYTAQLDITFNYPITFNVKIMDDKSNIIKESSISQGSTSISNINFESGKIYRFLITAPSSGGSNYLKNITIS